MKVPTVEGVKVILRPFTDSQDDIDRYTRWMEDDELRFQTGTEEMSRSDVEDMQKSWAEADDKFNFLITSKETGDVVGDIGLFFFPNYEVPGTIEYSRGEISMMIAEKSARSKGLGCEAFHLMTKWSQDCKGTKTIIAKIKDDNLPSIKFFTSLGFVEESRSTVFEEVTMELQL